MITTADDRMLADKIADCEKKMDMYSRNGCYVSCMSEAKLLGWLTELRNRRINDESGGAKHRIQNHMETDTEQLQNELRDTKRMYSKITYLIRTREGKIRSVDMNLLKRQASTLKRYQDILSERILRSRK